MIVTVVLGGMRSLTWSSSAQAIAAVLALLVPVTIVAVMVTNFPLPQLTQRTAAARARAQRGGPGPARWSTRPASRSRCRARASRPIAKRFTAPFGAIGPTAFVVAMLTVMAGVAASPWLLPRVTMTPGVYETRKSLGWATVFFGLIMLTAASVSVYMRDFHHGHGQGRPARDAARVDAAISFELGFVSVDRPQRPADVHELQLRARHRAAEPARGSRAARASSSTSPPPALSPRRWSAAAATASRARQRADRGRRQRLRRGSRCRAMAACTSGASPSPASPCSAASSRCWRRPIPCACCCGRLALTGSTLFPVLVLSIWWKRMNALRRHRRHELRICRRGADHPCRRSRHHRPRRGASRASLGLPAGTLGALLASIATPGPSRSVLELVREIRIPGGEVIYDREMRLLRLKNRERANHCQCGKRYDDRARAADALSAIEPYRTGTLDVGDGHDLYFEECGNPRRPAGRCWCMAARAAAPIRPCAASTIRAITASSCSISAAAAARRRTRRSKPIRPGISSPTWSACARSSASSAGSCSAARGARRWRSPMPRRIPSASPA